MLSIPFIGFTLNLMVDEAAVKNLSIPFIGFPSLGCMAADRSYSLSIPFIGFVKRMTRFKKSTLNSFNSLYRVR